jgi:hypothetical protein
MGKKKLIEQIMGSKVTKKTNERMTTIHLFKPIGLIDMTETKNIISAMEANLKKSGKKNVRIMVRGLAADKYRNIKYFDRDFDENQYDDYFKGKVDDDEKFKHFNQLQVYVMESL